MRRPAAPASASSKRSPTPRSFRSASTATRTTCILRAIAYEKSGRWFTAEEPFLRAKERTDAGSSAFRHPRSELIARLPQEVEPAFNNRKLHMRLPCPASWLGLDLHDQARRCRGLQLHEIGQGR